MDTPPEVDPLTGLTHDEAVRRLAENGYNELPSAKPRNVLAIAISVAREPMFMLLVACGTIYLLLGSKQEALMTAMADTLLRNMLRMWWYEHYHQYQALLMLFHDLVVVPGTRAFTRRVESAASASCSRLNASR